MLAHRRFLDQIRTVIRYHMSMVFTRCVIEDVFRHRLRGKLMFDRILHLATLLTPRRFLRVLSLGGKSKGRSNYNRSQQAKTLQHSWPDPEHDPSSV